MLLFLKPVTKKKLIWFPGAASVNIWLRSPHTDSSSAFGMLNFVFAHGGTSYRVTFPRHRPALA